MDISVIIATRNRGAWLPTCLTHLEQQTLPAARFEVLVADRASTDDTASVVRRFASGSPIRIRLLPTEHPGGTPARNLAAGEAEGRILLFLNDDELASPRLVHTHLDAQERRDLRGSLAGAIHAHPQLHAGSLTRLALEESPVEAAQVETPPYLDAQWSNLSIPKHVFRRFSGYSEEPGIQELEHIELAYRMDRDAVECATLDDARSYIWQPISLDEERERHYQIGYSLYHLLRRTHARSLLHRYRLRRSRLERITARFLLPYYIRACRRQEQENMLFVGPLYRRILGHERNRGFEDARNSRERRSFPGQELTAPQPEHYPA